MLICLFAILTQSTLIARLLGTFMEEMKKVMLKAILRTSKSLKMFTP